MITNDAHSKYTKRKIRSIAISNQAKADKCCFVLAAAGNRVYPRQYGKDSGTPDDKSVIDALDAIPECATGQANMKFFEFPLTDPVFTHAPRGSQGPDRVVAIAPNPGQGKPRTFTYCLAITHRGQPEGSFTPCTGAPITDLSLAPQD